MVRQRGRCDEVRPFRVAEYVRMSTEHQKYSIQNQSEVIRRHAERCGYLVAKTYEDYGKSGLER